MIRNLSIFLTLLAAAWLVYQPGLAGGYIFDDYPSIVNNDTLRSVAEGEAGPWAAYGAGTSGPLRRPLSMLSFALNAHAGGIEPYSFKLTNLILHGVNGFLVFVLVLFILRLAARTGTDGARIKNHEIAAFLCALFWVVHPINLTSVLYVVQRMNSLAAFFVFSGLIAYCFIRLKEMDSGRRLPLWKVVTVLAFTLPAALSKENGLLLPVYVLLIEWLCRDRRELTYDNTLFRRGAAVTVVFLSIAAFLLVEYAGLLDGYDNRDFTLVERVLTQARVVWFYIYIFLLPNEYNINLYYDAFPTSISFFDPTTTLYSIVALCLVGLLCLRLRHSHRLMLFGIALFFASHLMESTVFPLEMVYLHRNYIGGAGLAMSLVLFLIGHMPERIRWLGPVSLGLLILFNAMATHKLSRIWGNPLLLSHSEALNNPESYRTNYELGRNLAVIYARIERNERILMAALEYFERSARMNRLTTQPLLTLVMLASRYDAVEIKQAWLEELKKRAAGELFVSGEPAALTYLLLCDLKGACNLSDPVMDDIIGAYRRNPRYNSRRGRAIEKIIRAYEARRDRRGPGREDDAIEPFGKGNAISLS